MTPLRHDPGQELAPPLGRFSTAIRGVRAGTDPGDCATARSQPPLAEEGIGIWQRDRHTGEFVRQERYRSEFHLWAELERIPSRSKARRIVLVGESVARGYFYDPLFTCARLLEDILNGVEAGPIGYEVIDLARSGIDAFDIVPLIRQVGVLDPDVVVFWMGNNWYYFRHFTQRELAVQVSRIDEGHACGHELFVQQVLPRVARRVLDAAAEACRSCGIPGVLLIPEFNLGDWENDPGVLLPHLPGEAHVAWMRLRQQALAALQGPSPADALSSAEQMVALDAGLSILSHRLRGRALRMLGRTAEADEAFGCARDALCGVPVPLVPRCPAAVQNVLRERGAQLGLSIVDLPLLFRREFAGAVPDGRLFLDYCHLNLHGLTLAMAETAVQVLRALHGPGCSAPEWADRCRAAAPQPPGADQAVAHLAAAVHNAHHGQDYAAIDRLCLRAVLLDPEVKRWMTLLLDAQNRRAPAWCTRAFEELMRHPILERYLSPRGLRACDKFADDLLNRALLHALDTPAQSTLLNALIVEEHAPHQGPVDLLDFQYRAPTVQAREGYALGPNPIFLQATEPISLFSLAADGARAIRLDLTYRMPSGIPPAGEECRLFVNGHSVAQLPFTPGWRDLSLSLPATVLSYGSNRVEIHWPLQTFSWEAYRSEMRYWFQAGEAALALPVYGEVHQLIASYEGWSAAATSCFSSEGGPR